MDIKEFYDKVKACDEIPSTSQMSPYDVETAFRRIGKEHQIIYVSISARGSGINNTANMVAEQLKKEEGFDITVIDSGMFAMAIGYPVIEAAKLAEKGASLSRL